MAETLNQPQKATVSVKKPDPSKGLNQSEDVLMAMNIYAEARGESDEGKYAVANVVRNRKNASGGGWPNTFSGVILQKSQFSWTNNLSDSNTQSALYAKEEAAYDTCYRVGYEVINGGGSNPIGGCDHYCTSNLVSSSHSWAKPDKVVKVIGSHSFFNYVTSDDASALSADASKNAQVGTVTSGGNTTSGGTSGGATSSSGLTASEISAAVSYNKRNNASICKDIQRTVGLTGSDVDGCFGPQTVNAIAVWQVAHGLVGDGQWGPKSKAAALAATQTNTQPSNAEESKAPETAPSSSSHSSDVPAVNLTNEQISGAVAYNKKNNASICKDIQRTVGLTGSDVDGIFGPQTVKAIAVWQVANGLEGDGYWGPLSKAAAAQKNVQPEQPKEVEQEAPKVDNTQQMEEQKEAEQKIGQTDNNDKPSVSVPSFTDTQINNIKNWYSSQRYTTEFIKSFQRVVGTEDDGSVGKNTINAVAAWQASHGLKADGEFGAASATAAGLTIERKKSSGYSYSDGNKIDSGTVGAGGLTYLYTQDVAAIEKGRKMKEIIDLKTKERFNVSWDADAGYHSDCTPWSKADTDVFKHIRNPNKSADDNSYWEKTSSWSWDGREAAIKLSDGTMVACGYHQRPHAAIMGGNPGSPFQNQSNTKPEGGWAMGGHFCLYYGDSPGGTQSCNKAAQRAKDMSV